MHLSDERGIQSAALVAVCAVSGVKHTHKHALDDSHACTLSHTYTPPTRPQVSGATAHFDAVVGGATSGVLGAATDTGVPVIFGVLTCDTMEQVGGVGGVCVVR